MDSPSLSTNQAIPDGVMGRVNSLVTIFSIGGSEIREIPKKMVIVGGGYIALEVADMFHALGTEVHLFVRTERSSGMLTEIL